ncbi:MAG: phosphate ABC transporter substrate-binding protein PstS, partial [Actinomycetes bacterium]
MRNSWLRVAAAIPALAALTIATPVVSAGPAQAADVTVTGAGSTWSQIAVDQWRADVATGLGLHINYSGVGSSAGRQFYLISQVDFAVSEIPFLPDEVAKLRASGRSWQYLPIVAGGTALMYNLKDSSGRQVRDLRLTPATLAGIFTGRITDWADPAITADYGHALPARTIVPVVRSDGSGTSAQFSAYVAKTSPGDWSKFAGAQGIPATSTSNYPQFGNAVASKGSDGVANYVAGTSTGLGSIGYVETGFAVQRGFPVVAVRNVSGNYTLPSSTNVAVALTKATLNPDNTQNLDGVYANPAANAYPISSYSYMITPTTGLSPDKGLAIGKFMLYFACAGQQKASVLGYSPLPPNLIKVVFDAVKALPGAPPVPALTAAACANPTLSGSLGAGASSPPKGSSNTSTGSGAVKGAGAPGAGAAVVAGGAAAGAAGAPGSAAAGGAAGTDAAAGGGNGQYAALEPTVLKLEPAAGSAPAVAALLLVL